MKNAVSVQRYKIMLSYHNGAANADKFVIAIHEIDFEQLFKTFIIKLWVIYYMHLQVIIIKVFYLFYIICCTEGKGRSD